MRFGLVLRLVLRIDFNVKALLRQDDSVNLLSNVQTLKQF